MRRCRTRDVLVFGSDCQCGSASVAPEDAHNRRKNIMPSADNGEWVPLGTASTLPLIKCEGHHDCAVGIANFRPRLNPTTSAYTRRVLSEDE